MTTSAEQEPGPGYGYALHFKWLTRVYDPVVRWTCRETAFKKALIAQAGPAPSQDILDLGCGTGTLTIMVAEAAPGSRVSGLDGSADILEMAKEKSEASGAPITWVHGLSNELPFADASFDRVLSSLLFHHLRRADKESTLREVFRVLKPGGQLHIADWGEQPNVLMRSAFGVVRLIDGFETTSDNVAGDIPRLMDAAGFEGVIEPRRLSTGLGSISLYKASKPESE